MDCKRVPQNPSNVKLDWKITAFQWVISSLRLFVFSEGGETGEIVVWYHMKDTK